ncbi:MAG TPA: PadR family transcriptional regulator [Blastocatellia bacterium]|jgi:PadR family transcriptional regulator PadR|nr:PadR family transcriptional regulator [Blastocatellia bacterium]
MLRRKTRDELMPGTLEMLILKTLSRGSMHGYGIAQAIQQTSEDILRIEEGSLYPALQRMQIKGWLTSEWRMTEFNRKARFYELTDEGREQLQAEMTKFGRLTGAIWRVLENA